MRHTNCLQKNAEFILFLHNHSAITLSITLFFKIFSHKVFQYIITFHSLDLAVNHHDAAVAAFEGHDKIWFVEAGEDDENHLTIIN